MPLWAVLPTTLGRISRSLGQAARFSMCPFLGRAGQSGAPASLAFKAGRCFQGEHMHSCSHSRAITPFVLYRELVLVDSDLGLAMIVVKLPAWANIWRQLEL